MIQGASSGTQKIAFFRNYGFFDFFHIKKSFWGSSVPGNTLGHLKIDFRAWEKYEMKQNQSRVRPARTTIHKIELYDDVFNAKLNI